MNDLNDFKIILQNIEENVKKINETINGEGDELGLKGKIYKNSYDIRGLQTQYKNWKKLRLTVILGCLAIIVTEIIQQITAFFIT